MKVEHEQGKELLTRNVVDVIERGHLEHVLLSHKKLRVKLGIDPTASDLHLGNAVVLRKLREFQKLGHKIVLLIGDFTAQIGDPSGRSETRKPLTKKEAQANMKKYLAQAAKVIDVKKAEIRHNSEWFHKNALGEVIELAATASIQQVLRRADFKKRLDADGDITLLELLYPVFQGYDSVKIKADVEIGGTDQTFNLLMGRRVQRQFKMKEQDVLTTPLLEGLDGVKKMSKSLGNYIGLTDAPDDMFGKIMSIPDTLIEKYFRLCTEISEQEIQSIVRQLPPRDQKAKLAFEIVKMYHSEKRARAAEERFIKVFSKREIPDDIRGYRLTSPSIAIVDLVLGTGMTKSRSEARRLIEQGGVKIDGAVKKDPNEVLHLNSGETLTIGKRTFFRIAT